MATVENIKKTLETKKNRLLETVNSQSPIDDPALEQNHLRIVSNARTFLEELQEVFVLVENRAPRVDLVPKPTFSKQIEKADYASMEFDGEFCQIVAIQNYPNPTLWLVYTEPLTIL